MTIQGATHIPAADLIPSPGGTIRFEGEPYGSGVSFFLVHNAPGTGPVLHRHPYSETWIHRAGRALFTVGDTTFESAPGDIVVVEPNTPHKFTNIGETPLDLVCIHASSRFIQENLA